MMKICMVGTGYVGLVTGACFADMGNDVWCVDVDEVKITNLKAAILPIYEPGLKELVERNLKEGRLRFTTEIKLGIEDALFCFITVGTPPCEDGSADLSYIFSVAQAIGQCMNHYLIVVTKSTVPVGTTEKVRDIIRQELKVSAREHVGFDVVSNPEFLKEGAAVEDFMRPDRVVIGTENIGTAELMKQLYKPFVRNQNPILIMDTKSAEMTKYAANVMLAARISFMNEIAQLCDIVGGDITNIRTGIAADHRIGRQFLYAGAGYGGSCFPKDVKELISLGYKNGLEMAIATAVHEVNERQKHYLVDMIRKRFGEKLDGMRFGVWGLAFKPQTDDMREAPSLVIVQSLINMGAKIVAFDPQAIKEAQQVFEDYADHIQYVSDMMEAVNDADALVLITDWRQFRQPDFSDMKSRMRQLVLFDGRNQYDFEQIEKYGFEYYCIGRNYRGK
jgi:UDPglucose 6-dehydrogenase